LKGIFLDCRVAQRGGYSYRGEGAKKSRKPGFSKKYLVPRRGIAYNNKKGVAVNHSRGG
jgi:hypothetical protein